MMTAKVEICPDRESLARTAAAHFYKLARDAIFNTGQFSVALAGGSTPRAMYALLADDEYAHLDWSRIHIFWGDERNVPPDHPDSNYRMTRQALLDHISIPVDNIHRIRGEDDPIQAALEYEGLLQAFFTPKDALITSIRTFDLLLLGMGSDGHTASIFPNTPAAQVRDRWVVAVEHDQPPLPLVDRVSLALPAINAAAQIVFLVAGPDKAERLQQVFSPAPSQPPLPVHFVEPISGNLLWLIDEAAASP